MSDYAYGREQIAHVTEETTFGTLVQPTAADAMKVLSCSLSGTQERVDRMDASTSRSITSRVTRRKSADWSIEKYLLPSGTAGVAPDDMLLWEALFGTETIVTDTSVAYSLAKEPAKSLSIFNSVGHFREMVMGAVPSKWGLKFGGGDEPKVTFSGNAKDHLLCGSDTLASAASATSTITVNDASRFAIGMLVKVGDDDNTGSGFEITAIDYDTDQLTLDASVTDESLGAAVVPLPVSATTTGDIIPVIVGSFTVGGSTVLITSGSFDVDQKVAMRNDEFATASASGFRHPEFRDVTCSFDLYFRKGAASWLNDAKRFGTLAVEAVLGNTAGSIVTVSAPTVEFDIPSVDVPDNDECTLTLNGKCLGSSGEDELTVTFT